MNLITNAITASTATLSTLVLMAIVAPAAHAGEYCSTNTSGMRGCGFSSMEQCQATNPGNCYRDPFLTNTSAVMAYQPRQTQSRRKAHRTKKPAEY
jgi:hypothetical protein